MITQSLIRAIDRLAWPKYGCPYCGFCKDVTLNSVFPGIKPGLLELRECLACEWKYIVYDPSLLKSWRRGTIEAQLKYILSINTPSREIVPELGLPHPREGLPCHIDDGSRTINAEVLKGTGELEDLQCLVCGRERYMKFAVTVPSWFHADRLGEWYFTTILTPGDVVWGQMEVALGVCEEHLPMGQAVLSTIKERGSIEKPRGGELCMNKI